MSLFTSVDNQQMLWNLINKSKNFATCFNNQEEMQNWFRNIIENFHINNREPFNMIQLKQMNTTVIQYMIQSIKNIHYSEALENEKTVPVYETEAQHVGTQDTRPQETENTTLNSYEERQKEYYSLLEPQQPKNIDFTEKKENSVTMDDFNARQTQYESNIGVTNPLIEENKRMKQTIEKMQNDIAEMQKNIQDMKSEFIKNIANEVLENTMEKI
jgi:hypothetical protein